jgi:hypothetical protein
MPKRSSKPKRDFSQVAFDVVQRLTAEKPAESESHHETLSTAMDNPEVRKEIMREMGKRGGKKGGAVRAARLTSDERKAIASKAAQTRWKNKSS